MIDFTSWFLVILMLFVAYPCGHQRMFVGLLSIQKVCFWLVVYLLCCLCWSIWTNGCVYYQSLFILLFLQYISCKSLCCSVVVHTSSSDLLAMYQRLQRSLLKSVNIDVTTWESMPPKLVSVTPFFFPQELPVCWGKKNSLGIAEACGVQHKSCQHFNRSILTGLSNTYEDSGHIHLISHLQI